MERLEIGDDPGFFELVMMGKSVKLDTFEIHNKICDLSKEAGDDQNKLNTAVKLLLKELLALETEPSTAVAIAFIDGVFARVEDVRKKLGGPPASPSTFQDSTPSN